MIEWSNIWGGGGKDKKYDQLTFNRFGVKKKAAAEQNTLHERSPSQYTIIVVTDQITLLDLGGADLPPPSRIRVYAGVYAYTGANFFWLFLILSVEEDTTLLTPKKSPFSQELKKLVKFAQLS